MAQNKTVKDAESADMMSITGHLKELKNRVVVCLVVFIVAFIALFKFAPSVVDVLTELGTATDYEFVFLSPQELLMQYFRIAGIGALVVALPIILYEIWAFMAPGLSKTESVTVLLSMMGGLVFFALGVAFAYFISLRFMLNFFMSINTTSAVTSSISIKEYVGFILTIFLVFGCVFELPVVSALLSSFGLITPKIMVKARPYAIVAIFVVGALITPPDAVSQCMVAIPMILLYQISIYISKMIYKLKKQKEVEEEEA